MKNIYDIFNEINIDLNEYEKEDFNDLEKKRIKNKIEKSIKVNTLKRRTYKKFVSIASVAVISMVLISQTKIGLYAQTTFEKISDILKHSLGVDNSINEYSTNINQSITKKNLTIKVNNVILDGNELIIHLSKDYDKKLSKNEYIDLVSQNLYINNEKVNKSVKGYYGDIKSNKQDFVLGYELPREYKGNINVKLRIMDAAIMKTDDSSDFKRILGPWTFKFKVSGEKLNKDTRHIEINKNIKLLTGDNLEFISYKDNILNKTINLSIGENLFDKCKLNNNEIVLKGRDDLGNKIEFLREKYRKYNGKYICEYRFNKNEYYFDNSCKYLKLTPYITYLIKEKDIYVTRYKKIGEEIKINLKNDRNISQNSN